MKVKDKMNIIGEDEHYIYQQVSSSPDGLTIRRIEKPKKEILGMYFADGNYQFFVKTYSKNKDDIISVHFRNIEKYLIEGTYDYKRRKFDNEFIHSIKLECSEEGGEKFCDEFLYNLQEYIELMIDTYRDIEGTIKNLKENIKSKENLLSFLKIHHLECSNEIEDDLKDSYELLHKFENIYSKMKKQGKH